MVEERCLAVADGTGVLADIAQGVDSGGEFGKFFGFNCAQVMGCDPGRLSDLFECDANPFPCGSQTKARTGKLRSQGYSGGRHEVNASTELIGLERRED
jgi:hypothetical protein